MTPTGNTILITGGGSGIGRALAEGFHKLGNQVVIAGRRRQQLGEVVVANPGLRAVPLDIGEASSIRDFAKQVATDFPSLNVVIHNAGIMRPEDLLAQPDDLADAEATVATNLLGPIRLTAALLPLLSRQPRSTIMTVSSGLAFVPKAFAPTYCATKAAIHSYTQSLRHQLRSTTTEVIELIPPYVQTDLTPGQATDPLAMPLAEFVAEVLGILATQPTATEVVVGRCKPVRFAAENGQVDAAFARLNGAPVAR